MAYGDSLAADSRSDGDVPVYGSNGRVGAHDLANTLAPVIVVGRKGSHGRLQFSESPVFAIDTTYFVDRRSTSCNLRWLFYALSVLGLDQLSYDVGVPGLSRELAYEQRVPLPGVRVQRSIADFLDTETAGIDSLISKRQAMVQLLNERRAAVLQEGVGGIFTSSSALVESSVPWLVRRPDDWRDVKVNLVALLGSGHTPSRHRPEWWTEATIPWVTTGEVVQMRSDRLEFLENTREKISEMGLANSAAMVHPAGTVVLCRTAASAGYSAIMGRDMATSQDFATWTCGPLLRPRFLLLCLRAMRSDLLGRLAMGSTHKTIYMPDLEAIRIPLPPVGEQDEIIEEVQRRLWSIDRVIETLTRQIALLKERRQALITAAVTGELDVTKGAA